MMALVPETKRFLAAVVFIVLAVAGASILYGLLSGQSDFERRLAVAEEKSRISKRAGGTGRLTKSAVCAPTPQALDDVLKWAGVDENEFMRAIGKTQSVVAGPGDEYKMLTPGIIASQIRLDNGEACWVASGSTGF